jgi:hypothetical protein
MDLKIPDYVQQASDRRDAEDARGRALLDQLRTGSAEASPGAVAKIRRGTDPTPDLIIVDEITRLLYVSIEEGTA